MIPRFHPNASTVILQGAPSPPPPGECACTVHAMWGYTYEIPNFSDTLDADPGLGEFGWGTHFQYIVPSTTIVDQVTFYISSISGAPAFNPPAGPVHFGLYDLNQSAGAYPLVAQNEPFDMTGITLGAHTLALDSRITIAPGRYALAYQANCLNILSIRGNLAPWKMVQSLYNTTGGTAFQSSPELPPYGIFTNLLADPLPDELNPSNVREAALIFDETSVLPLVYFSDSQEFV